jgi:riboflavin kinase
MGRVLAFLSPMIWSFVVSSSARTAAAFANGNRRRLAPWTTAVRRLSSSDDQESRLVARQKEASQGVNNQAFENEKDFLKHQKQVFDELSDIFATGDTVPLKLVPIYKHLAKQILTLTAKKDRLRILDVACGTGALFPYLIEAASPVGVDLTGVDISPKMAEGARESAHALQTDAATVQVIETDIMKYQPDELFDLVIFNACFGNFWNATAVLEHASDHLLTTPTVNTTGGYVILSHPLGAEFVAKLHREDPSTVPSLLPTREELNRLVRYLPLQVDRFVQEANVDDTAVPFYFAALSRVRHVAMPKVMRFRGTVAAGFGRGGKKLGFPTANLSPPDFRSALQEISTGVYFGWAVIEGRNTRHKAVVNVGFSPTFETANAEKIIEAHLILDNNDESDFYGETMRLQLHGFLRPEIKFPSFPDLIAQITADRNEAKSALDLEPYRTLREDPFLTNKEEGWVGKSGGVKSGSWEFQNTDAVLEELS